MRTRVLLCPEVTHIRHLTWYQWRCTTFRSIHPVLAIGRNEGRLSRDDVTGLSLGGRIHSKWMCDEGSHQDLGSGATAREAGGAAGEAVRHAEVGSVLGVLRRLATAEGVAPCQAGAGQGGAGQGGAAAMDLVRGHRRATAVDFQRRPLCETPHG